MVILNSEERRPQKRPLIEETSQCMHMSRVPPFSMRLRFHITKENGHTVFDTSTASLLLLYIGPDSKRSTASAPVRTQHLTVNGTSQKQLPTIPSTKKLLQFDFDIISRCLYVCAVNTALQRAKSNPSTAYPFPGVITSWKHISTVYSSQKLF